MQVESLHDGEQRKEETSALLPACCRHGTALAVRDPGPGTTTTTTICLPRRRRGREMAAATAGSGACAQALFGRCRGSGPGLGARGSGLAAHDGAEAAAAALLPAGCGAWRRGDGWVAGRGAVGNHGLPRVCTLLVWGAVGHRAAAVGLLSASGVLRGWCW